MTRAITIAAGAVVLGLIVGAACVCAAIAGHDDDQQGRPRG